MLSTLPAEILLEIIQFLPFTTIASSLPTLSKSWATFMDTNESSIYHSISKRYGYADSGVDTPSDGWKAWFINKLQVDLRWIGKRSGNPYRIKLSGEPRSFYKIRVDEEAGYVINTFTNGGLVVSDIHDHSILWALNEEFCEPLAHCEYDQGYIVFNRSDGKKEVWRRRIDALDAPEEVWPSEPHNEADDDMIEASIVAQSNYGIDAGRAEDAEGLRGQFVAWACLLAPEDPEAVPAFRLTQGTLLVVNVNARRAFLYGIERAELEQTIEIQAIGKFQYADVSEEHLFIASPLELTVYDRASGSHVLSIPAGRLPWDFYASPENQWRRAEKSFNHGELGFRRAAPPNWAHREDYFDAVHVSSCGKHLAIMAMSNRVILLQDFRRLISPSPVALKQISKQVDFYVGRPSLPSGMETCLAYDRGKVAVFGAHGVFVLVLDSVLDQLGEIQLLPKDVSLQRLPSASEHEASWPNLRLREVVFNDLRVLRSDIISCLQLTETKLYLTVISDDAINERGENMWCFDFASAPLPAPAKSQGSLLGDLTAEHARYFLGRLRLEA